MPRYDELEHDSHADTPADMPPPLPPDLQSTTDAGVSGPAANPMTAARERLKAEREDPWCVVENDAIWVGDPLDD